MDDQAVDELRALRERAYGPDADIGLDPAALARLNELEGRVAAVPVDAGAVGPRMATMEDPSGETAAEAASAEPAQLGDHTPVDAEPASAAEGMDQTTPDGAVAPATASRFRAFVQTRKGKVAVSALALFLAAVIGAALTLATVDRHDRVAVLGVDLEGEWPEGYFGQERPGAVIYDDFFGLTPMFVPDDWTDVEGTFCLYITLTDSAEATDSPGIVTAGCTAGDFDATTAVLVNDSMPDALLERFPEGTALQFVGDDSMVSVYADTP